MSGSTTKDPSWVQVWVQRPIRPPAPRFAGKGAAAIANAEATVTDNSTATAAAAQQSPFRIPPAPPLPPLPLHRPRHPIYIPNAPASGGRASTASPSTYDDRDDLEDVQQGKKRKTPSSMQCNGRDGYSWDRQTNHTCQHGGSGEGAGAAGVGLTSGVAGAGAMGNAADHDHHHDHDEREEADDDDGNDGHDPSGFVRKNGKWVLNFYRARSPAAKANAWRQAMYTRRKTELITLFLDAQTAVTNELKKGVERHSLILPEVKAFEQMLPSLETVAVGHWPMDKPGWRSGPSVVTPSVTVGTDDKAVEAKDQAVGTGVRPVALEAWRLGYVKRRRTSQGRKAVLRGGWAPEGSFEFERRSEGEARSRAVGNEALCLR